MHSLTAEKIYQRRGFPLYINNLAREKKFTAAAIFLLTYPRPIAYYPYIETKEKDT